MLVCDRRFVWKYGLGVIRPRTPSLAAFVRRGYLFMADTLEDLARQVGVDPVGLAATVRANNADARTGVDAAFGKGGTSYDRGNGDPEHEPNPCLGPIERPPLNVQASPSAMPSHAVICSGNKQRLCSTSH